VYKGHPNKLEEAEKHELEIKIEEEFGAAGLITIRSGTRIDVMPKAGGKGNALNFILEKLGIPTESSVALGDDYNDLNMLSAAHIIACPGNAIPKVKELVERRRGYISPYSEHQGTVDMLQTILT